MITKPLKYHGGKHYLAQKIVAMMPKHLHYVETHAGGLSVLFAKPYEGISEVVNDLDGRISNFWKVLQSQELFKLFKRRVEATPFSENEYCESMALASSKDRIDKAIALFILSRQSRQALQKNFATLTRNRTRGGMNEQVSSWLTAVKGLQEVHNRLIRVVVRNTDACKLIKEQDSKNTLFYCDPPYLAHTRSSLGEYGTYEMTDDEHKKLLSTLVGLKGKFMLSGYPSTMYSKWARVHGFNVKIIKIDNKASSKSIKNLRSECIWMNF